MEPRAGDVVTENVRLVRLLGRGGMGSVWVARHESLDVDVAVKFVSRELLSGGDPLVVERFRREAKLAAKIESAHVVRVFDHGLTKEGTPYIVMEMLRGESIAERLARFKRLPAGDAARIVSEIASGLSAAHAMGIVHRDIKPHNVFLARSRDGMEIAKILDFGIAKTTNAGEEIHKAVKTSSGVLIGTPQYMSPEQLMRAGPPDSSADLWALAVVAYEMVTGRVPFAGETLAATLVAITRAEIQLPSSSIPDAPEGLDGFFARALAPDVAKRYPSASELASAFAGAAGGIVSSPAVISSDALTKPGPAPITSPDLSTAEFVALTTGSGGAGSATSVDAPATGGPPSGPGPEFSSTVVDASRAPSNLPTGSPTVIDDSSPAPAAGSTRIDASSSHKPEATKRSVLDDGLRKGGDRVPQVEIPRVSRRGRTLGIAIGAAAIVGVTAFVAGRRLSSDTTPSSSSPAPSADAPRLDLPSASISPSTPAPSVSASNSAAPAPKAVVAVKKQVVKDGRTADKVWVPDFWVQREPADGGKAFFAAEAACRAKKMALCTDPQLERACSIYGELANDPSWTFTAESGGIVVRGGESGCSTRTVVPADDVDASRSAVCCTRAVSIFGELDRFPVLRNVSTPVLVYENRFNLGQGDRIAKDSSGSVGFFGQTLAADKLAETIVWMSKTARIIQDQCKLSLIPQDPDSAWMAHCSGVELDLDKSPEAVPPEGRAAIGIKQIFQRFEITGSGLVRDIRTWQHPRRLITPP